MPGIRRAVARVAGDREEKYSVAGLVANVEEEAPEEIGGEAPEKTTTSAGSPCQRTAVPWRTLSALMGSAAARP